MGRRGWILGAWAAAGLALPTAAGAAATAHDGARVHTFARGFDFDRSTRIGPVGVAFDDDSLLVTARHLYRFGPGGGHAAQARITTDPLAGLATGLAWGLDGRLYVARHDHGPGDIVEVDPRSGSVLRVVADDLQCPTALATDPVTGDLFFSTVDCSQSIGRIFDPGGTSPQVRTFGARLTVDGLTFGPGGELYAAHHPDRQGRTISVIDVRRGRRSSLATVRNADGIALGRPAVARDAPPFLVVNRTDGVITKVDLQAPGAPQTDIVTGGSRGDLVAAGDDGCLYATQTDRVLQVTNANRTCDTGGGGALEHGLLPTRSARLGRALKRCAPSLRLKVGLRFGSRRLRSARVYLGTRRVTTVRGRALRRPVRLRGLPVRSFTVTIRATTRSGRTLTRRTRYSACGRHVLRSHRR